MKKILHLSLAFILLYTLSTSQSIAQDNPIFELTGFAAVGNGTTGGSGGDTITISTGTDLQNALKLQQDSNTPLYIIIDGLINQANSTGLSKIDIKEVDNVTIIGKEDKGEFHGIGLKVRYASNIIIRNIKVHHVVDGEGDCVSIEGPADHIWVDHCELYNEYQEVDKDYYDGLLDAKADSEYITYSWNFLHDSWKTCLIGSSESDTHDRKLTMHHNYFLNCNSRLPLFRASTGHFFNNYFKDIASTTINTRIGSCVRIENNYFENAKNPWVSAYSDILGGAETSGNILENSPFVYSSDTHEVLSCSPDIPYEYSKLLHSADIIPELVSSLSGVGKLDIGDDPVYTLSTISSGEGSLNIDPEKVLYDSGDVVTITAIPEADWEFSSWSGNASGTENPLVIIMNDFKTISALFTTDKLSLNYSTSGPGSVSISPDQSLYEPGTTVTLTASPNEGAYFHEWSGDLSGSTNPLEFQISSNTIAIATFKYESTDQLTLQFEENYCSLSGSVEDEHSGYTGSGFIDFKNEIGSGISTSIDATIDLVCHAKLRYAHGKTDDRSMMVKVNGITQIEDLDFPSTGSFTTWNTIEFDLSLLEGNNQIEWISSTSNGGPNFDNVELSTTESAIAIGSCSTEPEIVNAPSSFQSLTASASQINLSWTDNSDNETGFIIERMKEDETYMQIADLDQNSTNYDDGQLEANTKYSYRIKAYNASSTSEWSASTTSTTDPDGIKVSETENKILVYPNPADQSITFNSNRNIQLISIYSIEGKLLLELPAKEQNVITMNLTNFSKGIYIYHINTNKQRITGKFNKK